MNIINVEEDLKRALKNAIVRNPGLMNAIRESGSDIRINVFSGADVEDETWEKIYYRVRLEGLDIEDKMRIWDLLDDLVRGKVRKLRDEKYRLGSEAKRLDSVNRNLYVIMEL